MTLESDGFVVSAAVTGFKIKSHNAKSSRGDLEGLASSRSAVPSSVSWLLSMD